MSCLRVAVKTPSAAPSESSNMHEIIRLIRINYLIIYMNRSYTGYINTIDEIENMEQVIITDNKIKGPDNPTCLCL